MVGKIEFFQIRSGADSVQPMILVKNLKFLSRQLLFNICQDMFIQVVVDTKKAFLHNKKCHFQIVEKFAFLQRENC